MSCVDCGRTDESVVYLLTESGVHVCEYCWIEGNYSFE
jgi:hypothetical protein